MIVGVRVQMQNQFNSTSGIILPFDTLCTGLLVIIMLQVKQICRRRNRNFKVGLGNKEKKVVNKEYIAKKYIVKGLIPARDVAIMPA